MKNLKKILGTAALLTATVACEKDLDVTNPIELTSGQYWETQDHAMENLNSVYMGYIVDGTYMRMLPCATDARGDDMRGDSPWVDLVQFGTFTIPATSDPNLWLWRDHYIIVFRANQVLTYTPDIDFESEELKDRVMGQAYFLRGLAFFNLVTNFQQVPLVTELPNDKSKFYAATSSQEEIWAQIISDFQNAKDMLPDDYAGVTGPDAGQTGRATKGAATGMLGKAYLYTKQWQLAHNELNEVIQSGNYDLVSNFRDNFKPTNENNIESLFEIQFSHDIGGTVVNWWPGALAENNWMNVTAVGYTYAMDGFGFSDMVVSRGLYNKFKEEMTVNNTLDPRLLETITSYEPGVSTTVYGQPWPQSLPTSNIYPKKYTHNGIPGFTSEGGGTDTWSSINYRVLRFADILMMDAEALNELGQTAAAAPLIQRVRNRANMPDQTAAMALMTQSQMRDKIADERYLEFAIEGTRIHDLIRWGWFYDATKLAILKQRDPDFNSWQPGREYLPIPQIELDANPNLLPNDAN